MHRRNGAGTLIAGVLFLALASTVPAAAHGQGSVGSAPMDAQSSRSDGLTRAIQDTIAAHLVALELQRPELLASGRSADHPDVVAVDRRVAALRAQLSELPNAKVAEVAVNTKLMRAIEGRLASVVVERRLRAVDLPANHPDLQAMAKLEAALQQRRNELQRATR